MRCSSSSTINLNQKLNLLSKAGNIDEARHLFDRMPYKDEFSWNTMLSAYANSGRLPEANQIFHEHPFKTSVTWSTLISGYCKHGCQNEAFEFYTQMQFQGHKGNQYTLGSLLRLCSSFGFIRKGEQFHGYAVKTKLDGDDFVLTSLVDMYAKCECIWEAESLFEMVSYKKNHATWTAMLGGYSRNGDGFKAMECFWDMRTGGVESNQFTFPSILKACGGVSDLLFGIQVHCCIVRSGFCANIFVQSSLVDMYAKCGDLDGAKRVLRSMDVDDVISWNSIIVGCARLGFHKEALSLFREMHMKNMKIDEYSYPSVLNSFASIEDLENAKCIHSSILKTGFVAYKLVNNALVDMYAKQGKLDCAFMVFNQMPDKDVISWTSLITGYSYNGSHEEAIKLFCNMRIVGVFPDQIALASVLSACAELTVMEFGQQVHAIIIRSGLGSSLSVDNSLLSMYAKCGSIEDASCVFNSMQTQDVISWTALIVGFAKNGRGKDSLRFYDRMIAKGIKPDFITFIGLLFACSHTGLVEEGRHYFKAMEKEYRIKPGPEHYACMIDLFGRSGKLVEAKELLKQMVVEPDATVWKSLLAACRMHGELELGEIAANNLFELEPNNSMPYILLSNMYSVAERWEDAARIRRSMKAKGISKEPGYSWIEWNSKVHTFMSEDRNHPLMNEIYSKVDEIIRLIKEAGYVADMNFALHDMDREGKELGLAYHSEKLAVSFGLLTVPKGAPIRIFKNLRVCGDCHTAMKYISKVYLRHIILRDSNCFHHFRNGECSCGDYW
ncbi:Tetratricopeptide repeat (TPR)-like superfamily protein [Euphorbia peplus]|nr:Tetratricopeptide repeat (TPR)-like superfamily protein [Euphorbia peplus]